MLTRSKKSWELPWSHVTPERVYRSRREFLVTAAAGAAGLAAGGALAGCEARPQAAQASLAFTRNPKYVAGGQPNTFEELTNFNNFYEFGIEKDDPARYAHMLKTKPWAVKASQSPPRRGPPPRTVTSGLPLRLANACASRYEVKRHGSSAWCTHRSSLFSASNFTRESPGPFFPATNTEEVRMTRRASSGRESSMLCGQSQESGLRWRDVAHQPGKSLRMA